VTQLVTRPSKPRQLLLKEAALALPPPPALAPVLAAELAPCKETALARPPPPCERPPPPVVLLEAPCKELHLLRLHLLQQLAPCKAPCKELAPCKEVAPAPVPAPVLAAELAPCKEAALALPPPAEVLLAAELARHPVDNSSQQPSSGCCKGTLGCTASLATAAFQTRRPTRSSASTRRSATQEPVLERPAGLRRSRGFSRTPPSRRHRRHPCSCMRWCRIHG
jgi:hypothetical protein